MIQVTIELKPSPEFEALMRDLIGALRDARPAATPIAAAALEEPLPAQKASITIPAGPGPETWTAPPEQDPQPAPELPSPTPVGEEREAVAPEPVQTAKMLSAAQLAALRQNAERARAAKAAKREAIVPAEPRRPVQPPISRMESIVRVAKAADERPRTGEPIEVDLEQMANWAAPRGIVVTGWHDLDAVNRKRVQLGLPRFVRREGVR